MGLFKGLFKRLRDIGDVPKIEIFPIINEMFHDLLPYTTNNTKLLKEHLDSHFAKYDIKLPNYSIETLASISKYFSENIGLNQHDSKNLYNFLKTEEIDTGRRKIVAGLVATPIVMQAAPVEAAFDSVSKSIENFEKTGSVYGKNTEPVKEENKTEPKQESYNPNNKQVLEEEYYIQCGYFSQEIYAKSYSDTIKKIFPNTVKFKGVNEKGLWFRVLIGPYENEADYESDVEKYLDKFPKEAKEGAYIVKRDKNNEFTPFEMVRFEKEIPKVEKKETSKNLGMDRIKSLVKNKWDKNMIKTSGIKQVVFEYRKSELGKTHIKYGVNIKEEQIYSIIKKESNFDQFLPGYYFYWNGKRFVVKYYKINGKSVPKVTAKGLMQIRDIALKEKLMLKYFFNNSKKTAEDFYSGHQIWDAYWNMKLGTAYFGLVCFKMLYNSDSIGNLTKISYASEEDFFKFCYAAYNGGYNRIKKNIRVVYGGFDKPISFEKVKKEINKQSRDYAIKCINYINEYA